MKKLTASGVMIFLIGCLATDIAIAASPLLTSNEKSLALSANVDEEVLLLLRSETDSVFGQLSKAVAIADENGNNLNTFNGKDGVVFGSDAESSYNLVLKLRDKLASLGHLIFICDRDKVYNHYSIAVIKSTDQFDILRSVQTNGMNYNISNETVIARLSEWNAKYPFVIIAADNDFIEAMFIIPPSNMDQFANEVYMFCPDVVDSGSGSVKYMAKEMSETGVLYLWWR